MTQEELDNANQVTKEFLDKIDIWNDFLIDDKKETLSQLMDRIELMYNRTYEVQISPVFKGYVFNYWGESDFCEYLWERYGNKLNFYEETNTYYQLI